MWRCVCRWVNTPGLFTFQKKTVPSALGSEGPDMRGANCLQTAVPQQRTCTDCLASLLGHLQAYTYASALRALQREALYPLNCREEHHISEDHHCENLRPRQDVKFVLVSHF